MVFTFYLRILQMCLTLILRKTNLSVGGKHVANRDHNQYLVKYKLTSSFISNKMCIRQFTEAFCESKNDFLSIF